MAAALAGKDYFTLPQMMDIISQALKDHNVQWGHLDKTWDFEYIRRMMGVEFHRLRNAHSFAFTRTAAGITVRWKQWLTDSTWSRPLTLVSAIQMRDFYRLRPPAHPRAFPEATASGILAFLDKLDVLLAASTSRDSIVPAASTSGSRDSTVPAAKSGSSCRHMDRQLDMAWLRRVVRQEELSLKDCRSIDDVLGDLIRIGQGMSPNHGNAISGQKQFPDDVLVHLFPGSDVPSLPVDSLVDVEGVARPQQQKATKLSATLCGPGDRLILRNPNKNHPLPFLMAVMAETDGLSDRSAYVQWWLPGQSKKANHKGGKKKLVIDIYGPWGPASSVAIADLQVLPLPPPLVQAADVLEWGFDLTEDKQIPFETLDMIMDKHGIDITGLTLSSTSRGNQYRMYRLMKH